MGRLRGCIWLTAGLVVALLAGFVGFATLQRATMQQAGQPAAMPQVAVVVAARAVTVRAPLKAEDLALKNMPVDAAPQGALRTVGDATGKLTLVDLFPGEVVLGARLVDPKVESGDGRLAIVLADDQVLMAFPAQDLLSKAGVLKPGDHVDMLFSIKVPSGAAPAAGANATSDKPATFNGLANISISAIIGGQVANGQNAAAAPPDGILLTVSSQDALVLKYLKDNDGTLDLVLRAPGAEQPMPADPVDMDYLMRHYRLNGASGQ